MQTGVLTAAMWVKDEIRVNEMSLSRALVQKQCTDTMENTADVRDARQLPGGLAVGCPRTPPAETPPFSDFHPGTHSSGWPLPQTLLLNSNSLLEMPLARLTGFLFLTHPKLNSWPSL